MRGSNGGEWLFLRCGQVLWRLMPLAVVGWAVYQILMFPSVRSDTPLVSVDERPLTEHWAAAQRAGNLLVLDARDFDATLRPQPSSGSLWIDAWQRLQTSFKLDPCAARPPVIALLDIPGIEEISIPHLNDPVYRIRKDAAASWDTVHQKILDTLHQVGRYRCAVL